MNFNISTTQQGILPGMNVQTGTAPSQVNQMNQMPGQVGTAPALGAPVAMDNKQGKDISCGNSSNVHQHNGVIVVGLQGNVERKAVMGVLNSWLAMPGQLNRVSTGNDGTIVGVNPAGLVFQTDVSNGAWEQLPGQLKDISCGSKKSVWGVNPMGQLFEMDLNIRQWVQHQAPFSAQDVSVGCDGTVYAVAADGGIYRFDRSMGSFIQLPGQATSVSVHNAANVAVVNQTGQVFVLQPPQTWQQVNGISGPVQRISMSGNGLYYLDAGFNAFHMTLNVPGKMGGNGPNPAAVAAAQQQAAMQQQAMQQQQAAAMLAQQQAAQQQAMQQQQAAAMLAQQQAAQQQQAALLAQQQQQQQIEAERLRHAQTTNVVVGMGGLLGGIVGGLVGGGPTVAVQGAPPMGGLRSAPCPKCKSKGGMGVFGPTEPGHMHFRNICPVCNGTKYTTLLTKCQTCDGGGGIDAFGKGCESKPKATCYRRDCSSCGGIGWKL